MLRPESTPISQDSLISLAYDIANIPRGGVRSGDDTFSLRQIMYWIRTTYPKIISDEIKVAEEKRLPYDTQHLVPFSCQRLVEVDKTECSCACVMDGGCTVKKVVMPELHSYYGEPVITYVGRSDFREAYTRTAPSQIDNKLKGIGRFASKNKPLWYMIGKSIYVVFPVDLSETCNIGVIAMPQVKDIDSVSSDSDLEYDPFCAELPFSKKYVPELRERILKIQMSMMAGGLQLQDKLNNADGN